MELTIEEHRQDLIRGFFIIVIICALLIPLSFWLYDKSALGNPVCKQMSSQGYYETEWDTAGHESCIDNYKKGADQCNGVQKFMNVNPKDCYTGTINQTCMEERFKWDSENITSYGMHCVWGGPGYWAFVSSYGIIFILLALIIMWFTALWSYYRRNQKVYK